MAQRKIQLLRSTTVYDNYQSAKDSLTLDLALNANLSDGEIVLARYKEIQHVIGGLDREVIKCILAVFNDKNNLNGFTIINQKDVLDLLREAVDGLIQNVDDINSVIDGTDVSFNIDTVQDTNVSQRTADNSRIITSLSQENGQVYVGETAARNLLLTGYSKLNITGEINANDDIEKALNKLENAIGAIDVDIHSNDNSVSIEPDVTNGGKNVEVNVDAATILKSNSGALTSGLNMVKITDNLDANVREAYELQDTNGSTIGSAINIYKDSSLKEAYLGTIYDSVDSETGEVTKKTKKIKQQFNPIIDIAYTNLTEKQKTLFIEPGYHLFKGKTIITQEEYNEISLSPLSTLYAPSLEPGFYEIEPTKYKISDEAYASLTLDLEPYYEAILKYDLNPDYEYLSDSEYNEFFPTEPHTNLYNDISDEESSLNFVYHLEDGTYEMVKIDVSKFLTESEFGDGLQVNNGVVSVKIDPTDNYLSVSSNGVKIDLSTITTNALNEVLAGDAIEVSQKANNEQTISLQLSSSTLSNETDAQYAGEVTEDGVGGETVVNNNVLQIKQDGLYLDSSWDCGEY